MIHSTRIVISLKNGPTAIARSCISWHLSGVRGAEVFDAPTDERRNGLRWSDVDLENGTLEVLGKSREDQYVPLPERVYTALERYRRVAEPSSTDAFVFPTAHVPSKYKAVRDQLDDADEFLENTDVDTVIHEHEIVVPSISTAGAESHTTAL